MIDLLSDSEAADIEARDAATAAQERVNDTRLIMADKAGRRFVYQTIAELGGFDAVHGERGAGRHEAALDIIARIKEAGLAYWLRMIEENET